MERKYYDITVVMNNQYTPLVEAALFAILERCEKESGSLPSNELLGAVDWNKFKINRKDIENFYWLKKAQKHDYEKKLRDDAINKIKNILTKEEFEALGLK